MTGKILLESLGGTNIEDLGDKTAISEDHTLTWDSMLKVGVGLSAELAYKTLQANNIFENKDNTMADEFTNSTGINNTVNSSETTAIYDSSTNSYKINSTNIPQTEENAPSTNGPTTDTRRDLNSNISVLTQGIISSVSVGTLLSSSRNVTCEIRVGSNLIATKTQSISSRGFITFSDTDYTRFLQPGETANIRLISSVDMYGTSSTSSYSGTNFTYTSQHWSIHINESAIPIKFTPYIVEFDENANIVIDNNTLSKNFNTNSFLAYLDSIIENGSSIRFGVSDNTNTLYYNYSENSKFTDLLLSSSLQNINNIKFIIQLLSSQDRMSAPEVFGFGIVRLNN